MSLGSCGGALRSSQPSNSAEITGSMFSAESEPQVPRLVVAAKVEQVPGRAAAAASVLQSSAASHSHGPRVFNHLHQDTLKSCSDF